MELRVLLTYGVCNNRSTRPGRWREADFALSNRVVEWEAAVESRGRHRREAPDISENLQQVGWKRRGRRPTTASPFSICPEPLSTVY